jgi:hypothetical protein
MVRWAEHAARTGEKGNVYAVLVGKQERQRLLGIS